MRGKDFLNAPLEDLLISPSDMIYDGCAKLIELSRRMIQIIQEAETVIKELKDAKRSTT